jgi:EmrB/QacA subfamily drug resistance transporter
MAVPLSQARWILFAICILIIAINLDYTSVNLALVSMAAEVDSDLNVIQWSLSAYVLAWASSVVLAGRLADIFGKRRILLYGVGLFALSSLLIGMGTSTEVIISGRVLQGIGGALFVPSLYALTFSSFPPEKHGFAIGLVGGAAGIGLAIGPSFSGFLLEYLSWRWIFLINIPLALITMAIITMTVPKEPKRLLTDKVDLTGAALLGAALPLCICALNELGDKGVSTQPLMMMLVGAILFIGFFTHLLKTKAPLIPLDLFKNTPFFKRCMLPFMSHQFTFSVVLVMMGLYLQNVLNYPPFESGLIFLAMTLGFGVLSIYGGSLVDKVGLRVPSVLGLLILSIGTVSMTLLAADSSLSFVALVLMIIGIGLGLCLSSYNTAMMQAVPSSEVTLAAGVFSMGALISHTLAVVIATGSITTIGLYYAFSGAGMGSLPHDQTLQVSVIMSSAHWTQDLYAIFPEGLKDIVNESISNGFMFALHLAGLTCALLTGGGAWLANKHLHVEGALEQEGANPPVMIA